MTPAPQGALHTRHVTGPLRFGYKMMSKYVPPHARRRLADSPSARPLVGVAPNARNKSAGSLRVWRGTWCASSTGVLNNC
jgi:hypothetical protein